LVGQNAWIYCDLKAKLINLMPPTHPITPKLGVLLCVSLYRFCNRKRTQPWCCCYHFVADDTVESLISFTDFIIKKEVMELKTANQTAAVPIILASKKEEYIF
jgi:hypothetical protein